jgi:ubiquitin C-terminal hydrolase
MAGEGRPQEELYTDTTKHLMDIPDEEYVYKLVGVTIHRGTAEHGHYYSLINTKRG